MKAEEVVKSMKAGAKVSFMTWDGTKYRIDFTTISSKTFRKAIGILKDNGIKINKHIFPGGLAGYYKVES